ncbi:hypothetical protein JTB14_018961 [Gonioctena quinquepunctata]|nr:hypothetical protein JTB14_018961 [Gonioctena quinquepunctata]
MVKDIEVILWLPKVPNVGHLSMELSDTTYISFWPKEHHGWKKRSEGNTYRDDLDAEGRDPDNILYLPPGMVNQDRIKRWWKGFMRHGSYNLLLKNCASIVREALRRGGIHEDPVLKGIDIATRPIETPSAVYSWAGACKDLYLDKPVTAVMRQFFEPTANNTQVLVNWLPFWK